MLLLDIFGGLLPFLGLFLTICSFRNASACPFDALMRGSLVWACALVMVSNVLSVLTLLSFPCILAYWIVYVLFFAVRLFRMRAAPLAWPKPDRQAYVLACIALLTFVTALIYPPHDIDSMTYHLPKVMHWWQNGSFEHYYTSITRQTGLSPFAEVVVFHSFVLSGTDYLASLAQWSAFIGILCVVAATASLLGAGKTGQMLASLFFATLPIGIAQASGTRVDLVAGFWLACVAARFIIWKNASTASNAAYFGLAVGLAILTKGTGYVISLPFVLAFAFFSLKQYRQLLPRAVLSGLLALSMFAPHVYRSYTPEDPLPGTHFASGSNILFPPTAKAFLVTTLANILSNAPIPFMQHHLDQAYATLLAALDIDPDDTTLFPYGPVSGRVKYFSTNESHAPNPVHLLLLVWCLAGIGTGYPAIAKRHRWYVLAAVALFCLLLSWNRWITRLQPPLFVLAAPLAGIALEKACGKRLRDVFCALLMLSCVPVLFMNESRPLLPPPALGTNTFSVWLRSRDELYFWARKRITERYIAAADLLAAEGAESIGLVIGMNSLEYPLWALLRTRLAAMPQIRHIVPPATATGLPATPPAFVPQYLFVLERQLAWEEQLAITDDPFRDEVEIPPRLYKRVEGAYVRIL